jgi:hypothetical protein
MRHAGQQRYLNIGEGTSPLSAVSLQLLHGLYKEALERSDGHGDSLKGTGFRRFRRTGTKQADPDEYEQSDQHLLTESYAIMPDVRTFDSQACHCRSSLVCYAILMVDSSETMDDESG